MKLPDSLKNAVNSDTKCMIISVTLWLFGHFPRNCATGRIGRGSALKIASLSENLKL
ncbi:hypothetical protein [Succinimonas sp.]|uniref:hypothetical protein n=1 Tax=Succinimonas sp. TaxID=1936151 RepID=UPI003866ACC2